MSKIVNGTIVRPGGDLEAGGSGGGGGASGGGGGGGRAAKAWAAAGERVSVCGKDVALWQAVAGAAAIAMLLGGVKALFYVALAGVIYTMVKAFGGGSSSSSSSSGGGGGGGGGRPRVGRARGGGGGGGNIRGIGDLPKPVSGG